MLLLCLGTGALVMRGAGCTINNLWDQDIDCKVERTKNRPLASRESLVKGVVSFLALQLSTGLAGLLSLPNTWYCFQWGVAIMPLVGAYPTTKQFFPYPQLILGMAMNWGVFMGWTVLLGNVDPTMLVTNTTTTMTMVDNKCFYSIVLPLYGLGVCWTIVYDTLYTHQDKHNNVKLGLRSTALSFGDNESVQQYILHGFASLAYVQWMMSGYGAASAMDPTPRTTMMGFLVLYGMG